nr:hypothetical protein [Infirmifilum lucidum]
MHNVLPEANYPIAHEWSQVPKTGIEIRTFQASRSDKRLEHCARFSE